MKRGDSSSISRTIASLKANSEAVYTNCVFLVEMANNLTETEVLGMTYAQRQKREEVIRKIHEMRSKATKR